MTAPPGAGDVLGRVAITPRALAAYSAAAERFVRALPRGTRVGDEVGRVEGDDLVVEVPVEGRDPFVHRIGARDWSFSS